jgi:GDP-L-fucose synthase
MIKGRDRVFISGQEGMVGSAIFNLLKKKKINILSCKRSELDLTNQKQVEDWINKKKPDIVINAAGRVGGILDNLKNKEEYIYINAMIGLNLVKSSFENNVKKFINLSSACVYPKKASQPIDEGALLTSFLEPTNEGYALAKILVLKYCEYINLKYKKNYITLQPANLYGYGDNFDLKTSHVLPALIKKFHIAKQNNNKIVEVWGTGKPEREFLHVNDLAEAIYFCLSNRINHTFINVGGADRIKIKELCSLIKKITNFEGKIFYNNKYPDGVLKRNLSNKILKKYGWKPKIKLQSKEGLKAYYEYFKRV